MANPKLPNHVPVRLLSLSLPVLVASAFLGTSCGDNSSSSDSSDAGSAGEPDAQGGETASTGGRSTGGTPAEGGSAGEPDATGGTPSASGGEAGDTGGSEGGAAGASTGGTAGAAEAGASSGGDAGSGQGGEPGTGTGGAGGVDGGAGEGGQAGSGEAGAGGEAGEPGGCLLEEPDNGASCSEPSLDCGYEGDRECECLGEEGASSWGCVTTYACEPGCYNHACPGLTDFCVADFGQCEPVPCIDDSDCCGLATCDNLSYRCDNDVSPYFFCTEDDVCQRAPMDYEGVCRDAHDIVPQDGTCEDPCPTLLPANGSRCMPLNEVCTYEGPSCTCSSEGDDFVWVCVFPI